MEDEMEEIWALYADDGAQALDAAEEALALISDGSEAERKEGISSLFRAVHTFKGNSRVLGLQVAESRAHLTEDLIGLVRDAGAEWDDEVESIMLLAVDRLRSILEQTAATRADADEGFATDLMDRLRAKIERISGGGPETPEFSEDEPEDSIVAVNPDDGASAFAGEGPVAEEEAALPVPVLSFPETSNDDLIDPEDASAPPASGLTTPENVLGPILDLLGELTSLSTAEARRSVLTNIARLARDSGYLRLSDLAADLAGKSSDKDSRQDIRLYEELYAIELSQSREDVPSPRPRDLLSGWCADHAFSLIDDLRQQASNLSERVEIEASLRAIEPTLRRIHAACEYYGLSNAALLSMSLLDLVLRVSPDIGRSKDGPDDTVIHMLQTFIPTVELALDAAKEGEQPDTTVIDELSEASNRFEFTRRGAPTATEALETLKLPGQFLRVMSPRSVVIAQKAAESGMDFHVVRTAFQDHTSQAERFFQLMEDGAIRQITSVSVLVGTVTKFDFLLATALDHASLAARLASVDPTGNFIAIVDQAVEQAEVIAGPNTPDSEGVSVEMMEMLGEVSSGLASVMKQLRSTSEGEARSRVVRAFAAQDRHLDDVKRVVQHEFDQIFDLVDRSLLTMDHLVRRVATLQEEAMVSRLRPADHALRPLVDQLRLVAKDAGKKVQLEATFASVPLDIQTLEVLERIAEDYLTSRIDLVDLATCQIAITLRQRDDRIVLMITDDLKTEPDPDHVGRLAHDASESGGRAHCDATDTGHSLMVSMPTRMLAMEAMIVTSGGVYYVLPVDSLQMVVRAPASQIVRAAAAGSDRFLHLEQGEVLPIVTLEGGKADGGGLFLIVQAEGHRKAVLVDALHGQEVVRLRPLQGVMARLERLAGLAVLAGGEVALVLSPLSICGAEEMKELQSRVA